MTMLHMLNCFLTAGQLPLIIYTKSSLSEAPGGKRLVSMSALIYLATQLCKSVLWVILPLIGGAQLTFWQELIKNCVNLVELVGMRFAVQRKHAGSFSPSNRILGAGLGWGVADAIANNAVTFIRTARPHSFTWTHIHCAVNANVTILSRLALVALVARTWDPKSRWPRPNRPMAALALLTLVILPTIQSWSQGAGRLPLGWAATALGAVASGISLWVWRREHTD